MSFRQICGLLFTNKHFKCLNIRSALASQLARLLHKISVLISRGHTHLSHSFTIHTFSLKLLKDFVKIDSLPYPAQPLYGEEH